MSEKTTSGMNGQKGEAEDGRRVPGSTIDAEKQDKSGADHSPARQKDQARDEPRSGSTEDAGPEEDTYD